MKTPTKWFIGLASGAAALLVTASTGLAGPFGLGGGGGIPGLVREKLQAAGFTSEQRAQARTVVRQHAPTMLPLVKKIVQERRALRDLVAADQINEAAIRAQSARLAQFQAELAVESARLAQDLRKVATPEQLGKVRELERAVRAKVDEKLDQAGAWLSRS